LETRTTNDERFKSIRGERSKSRIHGEIHHHRRETSEKRGPGKQSESTRERESKKRNESGITNDP
jgi:hypothetical protein